jgi:hypothetical protein
MGAPALLRLDSILPQAANPCHYLTVGFTTLLCITNSRVQNMSEAAVQRVTAGESVRPLVVKRWFILFVPLNGMLYNV